MKKFTQSKLAFGPPAAPAAPAGLAAAGSSSISSNSTSNAAPRLSLAPVSGNALAERPAPSADDAGLGVPVPKRTKTTEQLAAVSREDALAAIERLVSGYRDKSGYSYPAAATNAAGCTLAQKAPNRADNGYVQIAPIVVKRSRAHKGEEKKKKLQPQGAHRLAVVAYKSDEDVARLLAGGHASHLCHQPTCINPDHLVVETKEANEGRKACKNAGNIIRFVLDGHTYLAKPKACECPGDKCIFMIEDRVAELLE